MNKLNSLQWQCGTVAMAGACALLVGDAGTSYLHFGVAKSEAAASPGWIPLTALFLVAMCGASAALVGLQVTRSGGRPGALTSAWAFIGTLMFSGICWTGTFVLPVLATRVPEFVDSAEHPGVMALGYAASMLLFATGWAALAVAAGRSGQISARVSATLALGATFTLVGVAEVPLSFVPFAFGLLALGAEQRATALGT